MGQYHKIYNVDKKQFLHPHDLGNGLKLMEQVGHRWSTSTALFLLLANSNGRGGGDASSHPWVGAWAGDRIVIQGDYAKPEDQSYIADTEGYTNVSKPVLEMLRWAVGD